METLPSELVDVVLFGGLTDAPAWHARPVCRAWRAALDAHARAHGVTLACIGVRHVATPYYQLCRDVGLHLRWDRPPLVLQLTVGLPPEETPSGDARLGVSLLRTLGTVPFATPRTAAFRIVPAFGNFASERTRVRLPETDEVVATTLTPHLVLERYGQSVRLGAFDVHPTSGRTRGRYFALMRWAAEHPRAFGPRLGALVRYVETLRHVP